MLQNYFESDMELLFLDNGRFCLEKKILKGSPFFFFFLKNACLYFKFSNIVNIESFFIQRFFLVLWLFTGCIMCFSKYNTSLRLGTYYHHFFIKSDIKKRKIYNLLSFFLDDFLKKNFNDGFFKSSGAYRLIFNDLNVLTNKKLARGVYFYRIQQKLYLDLIIRKVPSIIFYIYINSLKLLNEKS